MTLTALNARIKKLEAEDARLTKELYRPDLDALSRMTIDRREQEIITELAALHGERRKRGRRLAEKLGLVKSREGGQP